MNFPYNEKTTDFLTVISTLLKTKILRNVSKIKKYPNAIEIYAKITKKA